MLFNSLEFFIFFPIVVAVYFLLPFKFRWILLLGSSYYFYMAWKAEYIVLIIISTIVDYFASQKMAVAKNKKPWLWLSICANLGILFTFKYYNFFSSNIQELFQNLGISYALPISELILPMGISFYTFQTMSYTIDVYYGRIKPEKHFGYFALYVTYFPQLVAGPIERAGNLLHQFRQKSSFEYSRVSEGFKQMLWGFFKKMVIADNIAVLVNMVYNHPTDYDGLTLLFATYLFAFQIYCDFSGYSDIAIGASKILGIKLMENFKVPYLSKNISEFWRRWHISLSTWFRDYLYIPLGGNRVVKWRWYYNLVVVFLVSGFWHGANWTFIVWGGLHGAYLLGAIIFKNFQDLLNQQLGFNKNKEIGKLVSIFVTFHLVVLAWIFFRANTIEDAFFVTKSILTANFSIAEFYAFVLKIGVGIFAIKILLLAIFIIVDPYVDKLVKGLIHLPSKFNYLIYSSISASIMILGYFGEVDFIYFQF